MNETHMLGIIILVLWIAIAYLRVPAAILFLSILTGKLFAEELSLEVYDFIAGIVPGLNPTLLQIILLVLPAVLTIIFLKGSVAKSGTLLNVLPLLLCLVTLGIFINPYFDVVSRLDASQQIILTANQSYIVSLSGALILLSAWLPRLKHPAKHGSKHK
ncbi:hypothetical protein KY385_01245 [Candidatus Parcubacteria bacterium]|nr:hypothetical protein [Candidatus Parcubacteria bacterium]